MGGDDDGNEGTLPEQACPGHHYYNGGGQTLPPVVPPLQHVGATEGPERVECHHSLVCQGGAAEETSVGGR